MKILAIHDKGIIRFITNLTVNLRPIQQEDWCLYQVSASPVNAVRLTEEQAKAVSQFLVNIPSFHDALVVAHPVK